MTNRCWALFLCPLVNFMKLKEKGKNKKRKKTRSKENNAEEYKVIYGLKMKEGTQRFHVRKFISFEFYFFLLFFCLSLRLYQNKNIKTKTWMRVKIYSKISFVKEWKRNVRDVGGSSSSQLYLFSSFVVGCLHQFIISHRWMNREKNIYNKGKKNLAIY